MINLKNVKLFKREPKEIPIFFATDDNYIPFLDVAVRSMIENASKKYKYVINVLNTGLKEENMQKVKLLENENFTINFVNITDYIEPIRSRLKNVYHFSVVMYYRLFIESMFPQYSKVIYLDCDIVVLGDISKLYNTILGNNLVAAVREQIICNSPVFSDYTQRAMGIDAYHYFNSGILLMNLDKFRKERIEDKFVYLVNKYNFDLVDPDQAYLNVLCKGKIKFLQTGWNKESLPEDCEGKMNIAHYALYKKPWQYDDVINGEYFWHYAKQSPFYDRILEVRASFDDVKKAQKEQANEEIATHSTQIANSEKNIFNTLFKKEDLLSKLKFDSDALDVFDLEKVKR
ncbi:MAG: glycosyltransferase family 8 protein [Clostridia bacterium]|nr:glycosyltransferase family 8 protein [Clostridia bacterium]